MKIVLTGASGFVGHELVPALAERGAELLLVGRSAEKLAKEFPGYASCDYEALPEKARGFDLLVHLAVANNNSGLSEEESRAINVDLLLDVASSSQTAGIQRFINVSSIHALDEGNSSIYARTKREGQEKLAAKNGMDALTLYLPMVYGSKWAGKLSTLNSLPRWLAKALFSPVAALKPTVDSAKIANFLIHEATTSDERSVILTDDLSRNPFFTWGKRFIDVSFALVVIGLFWWAMLIVWALVRFSSPGPGIFAQARVGKGEKDFTCYKFRTMRKGTKQAGSHEVGAAAVTNVGKFLRRTKLDELPQAWNILINELSLVGPRPCLPNQTEMVAERRKREVFSVKPGLTGLCQLDQIDMSRPEEAARKDAEYIALRSLLFEIKIIIVTFLGRGRGDQAAD